MKAVVLIAAIAAAVAVTAPAALARQGYFYLGDTLSADAHAQQAQGTTLITDTLGGSGHAQQPQGITLITDTLGGKGEPNTFAPTSAEDARRFTPGWRPSTGQEWRAHPSTKPYIYGGAPPAVAQAGSGFYRAHLSPTPAQSSGDGFNWGDAGLGAVTGFGALFLLAGTSMLVRRRNQQLAL